MVRLHPMCRRRRGSTRVCAEQGRVSRLEPRGDGCGKCNLFRNLKVRAELFFDESLKPGETLRSRVPERRATGFGYAGYTDAPSVGDGSRKG